MILRLTSSEQTTKFPAHSALLIQNGRRLVVDLRQKKIYPPAKGKQTSSCLEICFCEFCWSAVEVSCLKMVSNEFNSLRKTLDIKIESYSYSQGYRENRTCNKVLSVVYGALCVILLIK